MNRGEVDERGPVKIVAELPRATHLAEAIAVRKSAARGVILPPAYARLRQNLPQNPAGPAPESVELFGIQEIPHDHETVPVEDPGSALGFLRTTDLEATDPVVRAEVRAELLGGNNRSCS